MDVTSTDYDLVSRVNVSPITCKWVIENFNSFYSNCPEKNTKDNKIVSSPFEFGNGTATKGFFSLVHKDKNINYGKGGIKLQSSKRKSFELKHVLPKFEVNLHIHSKFKKPVKFVFRLEILGSDDVFSGVKNLSNRHSSVQLCHWDKGHFPSINCVKDGTLTLIFHLTFHGVSNSVSCNKKSDSAAPETDGFGCILGDKEFSDVTFIAGDQEIPAHKALLAAKSPVFAAMFKSRMKEEQTNRIEIPEKSSVFEELLRFIYAGKIEKQEVYTEDLFVAADKYGIDQLASLCEKKLARKLNASNALQLLVFADFHGAGHLKCEAIDFINSHASEVTKTQGWKALIESKPHLLAELYNKLAMKFEMLSLVYQK